MQRCQSCKKLKIKCDGVFPQCEYCSHTGRQCVYTDASVVIYRPHLQLLDINSLQRQLGVTGFQFRLLKYFHESLLPQKVKEAPILDMWQKQVPYLFHESVLVRNSMYCLSCMNAAEKCDLSGWIDDVNETNLFSMVIGDGNLQQFLKSATSQYYRETLQDTFQTIQQVIDHRKVLTSVTEAAEIVFSSSLLFSYLSLQTDHIVPLLSPDTNQPDLVSMSYGMREAMMLCFPLLFKSPFSALFYKDELMNPPKCERLPFTKELQGQLDALHENARIPTSRYVVYEQAVATMGDLMAGAAQRDSSIVIYKWLFMLDAEVYRLMRLEKDQFALKLLFIYSCFNIFTGFYICRQNNVWMDYIDSYMKMLPDEWDQSLYSRVHSGYLFAEIGYSALYTF